MSKIRLIKNFFVLLTAFIHIITIQNQASAQYFYNDSNNYYEINDEEDTYKDKFKDVNFPKGSMLKAVLQHTISSEFNNINDPVEVMIMLDMQMDGITCMPKGTKIIGKISKITEPEIGKNGSIQIIFHTIKIPGQNDMNILGYIWTEDGYSTLGGELTQRTGFKRVVHKIDGIGGLVQLIPDGQRAMGKHVQYMPGEEFVILLETDLSFKVLKD